MTHTTDSEATDMLPPPGTAIIRPAVHVQAVRQRHIMQFADAARLAGSRSARAWAWALGETTTAPVTDRETGVPPSRPDIEIEITAADERRLRGDREDRADAAATILRWLIGDDDHVPVRCENPGELVGGFGDVVRPRQQMGEVMVLATAGQQRAGAMSLDRDADPGDQPVAHHEVDYLDGVAATLAWVLGESADAPITRAQPLELTTRDLKTERVHAEDVIDQGRRHWVADWLPPRRYGEAVRSTISWLLGDSLMPPTGPSGI